MQQGLNTSNRVRATVIPVSGGAASEPTVHGSVSGDGPIADVGEKVAEKVGEKVVAKVSAKTAGPTAVPAGTAVSKPAVVTSDARVADAIREVVGAELYERFFKGQTRLVVTADGLTVVAPTSVLSQLIERRFLEPLKRVAALLHGTSATAGSMQVMFRADRAAFPGVGGGLGGVVGAPWIAGGGAGVESRTVGPISDRVVSSGRVAGQGQGAGQVFGRARSSVVSSRFRFSNFIVGRSNRLAYSAAMRVADEDGPIAPLFVHGTCGLGKTHLLQSVCARFLERKPGALVRYVNAESFTNEYIQAVKTGKVEPFRSLYRKVDLLCVDDIHFVGGKEGTQQEILYTFDAIGLEGARVVLSSDEHPREIHKLSERLMSRFMAGAVVKIEVPDPELRERLVRHLAERRGLPADEAAIKLIAERSGRTVGIGGGSMGGFGGAGGGSVREIEGLLNQIEAVHKLLPEFSQADGRIGVVLVRRALGLENAGEGSAGIRGAAIGNNSAGMSGSRVRRPLSADAIIGEACKALAVEMADFLGSGRHKRVVLARSMSAYLCRRLTTMSFPEIARAMGRNNHSTIITAERRMAKQLEADPVPLGQMDMDLGPAEDARGLTLRELADRVAAAVTRG